jgi:DNA topoisomerase VI subunit A
VTPSASQPLRPPARVAARYILVVEKDAVFQRLVEDRLHERLPLVLVTAKGNPDLATRAFLCRCGGGG